MSTCDHRLVGVEALARWTYPPLGPIGPDEFIPIAEESGLIEPLGAWVLRTACAQLAAWRAAPVLAALTMTVNVSVHQLGDQRFPAVVRGALEASGLAPEALCVELTETALMAAGDGSLDVSRRSRRSASTSRSTRGEAGDEALGRGRGTGYSSLAALKRLPVEVLKVDRSFVDGLGTEPEDSSIVATVMSLAHALGLHVIAESVETPLQASELAALGAPWRRATCSRGRCAPPSSRPGTSCRPGGPRHATAARAA